tara:strand:+ start:5600 stop:5983 length:384 start_codon:yes stop_codon:yes gene_type:complete
MKIYRVNDKHYTNYNLALLEGVKENYAIITIEVNDTKEFYIERDGEELLLIDDDGNEYVCECDFYCEDIVVDRCHITDAEDLERVYNFRNIQIERKPIEHFNLDPVTIEQINNEFEDICQMKTEDSI